MKRTIGYAARKSPVGLVGCSWSLDHLTPCHGQQCLPAAACGLLTRTPEHQDVRSIVEVIRSTIQESSMTTVGSKTILANWSQWNSLFVVPPSMQAEYSVDASKTTEQC